VEKNKQNQEKQNQEKQTKRKIKSKLRQTNKNKVKRNKQQQAFGQLLQWILERDESRLFISKAPRSQVDAACDYDLLQA
jgi:hypothetical protein